MCSKRGSKVMDCSPLSSFIENPMLKVEEIS